jgi:DNA invertase Pin-like site-specific DNA recombinase
MDLLENSLPSFWDSRLSRIFAAGAEPSHLQLPKPVTVEQRIQKAKELHQQGLSYDKIAKTLNVAKGTAYNYINGYPYKPQSARRR